MDNKPNELAVMFSLKPKFSNCILARRKTIEVRRRAPQLKEPYTEYIYETQGYSEIPWIDEDGHAVFRGLRLVVGEFTVVRMEEYPPNYTPDPQKELAPMCLLPDEFRAYQGTKPLYGIHIQDVLAYGHGIPVTKFLGRDGSPLTRAPQSWCYIRKASAAPEDNTIRLLEFQEDKFEWMDDGDCFNAYVSLSSGNVQKQLKFVQENQTELFSIIHKGILNTKSILGRVGGEEGLKAFRPIHIEITSGNMAEVRYERKRRR